MFTLPNLHQLIGNYRSATPACNVLKPLTPSMLLGSRKGRGADSAYKTVERSLKAPPDDEAANSYWKGTVQDYGSRSVLLYLNSKRDSPFVTNAEMMQFAETLGNEEGYYWRRRGNHVDDLSSWRVLSAHFRGFIVYCNARHSGDDDWPRGRKQMKLALADIEALELLSAECSLSNKREGLFEEVGLLLDVHPLGKTSAGRELSELLRSIESEQAQVSAERASHVGLKMALTGILWKFALLEAFLCPKRPDEWPLLLPKTVDGQRCTASQQWVERLKVFVEDGPLTELGEWPKPRGRGKPSTIRHIAEFLYTHDSKGRSPDKLAEKLGRILNGREQLTFKFVEETNRNLRASTEMLFNEETDSSEDVAKRFEERLSTLNLDGHVVGFADYLERTFERGITDKGLGNLQGAVESVWAEWPALTREVVPFIKTKWDSSESDVEP